MRNWNNPFVWRCFVCNGEPRLMRSNRIILAMTIFNRFQISEWMRDFASPESGCECCQSNGNALMPLSWLLLMAYSATEWVSRKNVIFHNKSHRLILSSILCYSFRWFTLSTIRSIVGRRRRKNTQEPKIRSVQMAFACSLAVPSWRDSCMLFAIASENTIKIWLMIVLAGARIITLQISTVRLRCLPKCDPAIAQHHDADDGERDKN